MERSRSQGDEKLIFRHSIEIVKEMNRSRHFKPIHPADTKNLKDEKNEKTNDLMSQDQTNKIILEFAENLFTCWLEDYGNYVESVKENNMAYHMWAFNEGAQKNIRDKCLPIDYFMEKCLQVGLVASMKSLQTIIDIMLIERNEGFTEVSPPEGLKKDHGIEGLPPDPEIPRGYENKKDTFIPMNCHSKSAERFIRQNLDTKQF